MLVPDGIGLVHPMKRTDIEASLRVQNGLGKSETILQIATLVAGTNRRFLLVA